MTKEARTHIDTSLNCGQFNAGQVPPLFPVVFLLYLATELSVLRRSYMAISILRRSCMVIMPRSGALLLFLLFLCFLCFFIGTGQATREIPIRPPHISPNWIYVDSSPVSDGAIRCKAGYPPFALTGLSLFARSALQICADQRRGGGWHRPSTASSSGLGARCGDFMMPPQVVFRELPAFGFEDPPGSHRFEDAAVRIWCQNVCKWLVIVSMSL
jgi:hypothetical protein